VWQRRRSVRIIAEFNRRWAESAEDATRFLHDAYDIAGTGCAFHEYGTLPIYVKGELLRIVFDAELSLGRPEQALALVTDCAGLAPDYAAPYVMRARCLFEMGQLDKAVAELQRGLPYDERGQIAESLEHLRIQRIDIGRPS
jgi:tetratricopeptide (TPR) repeat protein